MKTINVAKTQHVSTYLVLSIASANAASAKLKTVAKTSTNAPFKLQMLAKMEIAKTPLAIIVVSVTPVTNFLQMATTATTSTSVKILKKHVVTLVLA